MRDFMENPPFGTDYATGRGCILAELENSFKSLFVLFCVFPVVGRRGFTCLRQR